VSGKSLVATTGGRDSSVVSRRRRERGVIKQESGQRFFITNLRDLGTGLFVPFHSGTHEKERTTRGGKKSDSYVSLSFLKGVRRCRGREEIQGVSTSACEIISGKRNDQPPNEPYLAGEREPTASGVWGFPFPFEIVENNASG